MVSSPNLRRGRLRPLAFAALPLVLLFAAPARAAAPPTGDPGLSIAAAFAESLAGSISAGGQHGCGVKTDGSVACWGSNEFR
jgi:Regulator of Chromosome Condensation (RCC1) repeat protein